MKFNLGRGAVDARIRKADKGNFLVKRQHIVVGMSLYIISSGDNLPSAKAFAIGSFAEGVRNDGVRVLACRRTLFQGLIVHKLGLAFVNRNGAVIAIVGNLHIARIGTIKCAIVVGVVIAAVDCAWHTAVVGPIVVFVVEQCDNTARNTRRNSHRRGGYRRVVPAALNSDGLDGGHRREAGKPSGVLCAGCGRLAAIDGVIDGCTCYVAGDGRRACSGVDSDGGLWKRQSHCFCRYIRRIAVTHGDSLDGDRRVGAARKVDGAVVHCASRCRRVGAVEGVADGGGPYGGSTKGDGGPVHADGRR